MKHGGAERPSLKKKFFTFHYMGRASSWVEILQGISAAFVYFRKSEFHRQNEEVEHLLSAPHEIYVEENAVVVKTKLPAINLEKLDERMSQIRISGDFEEYMRKELRKIACRCSCTVLKNESALRAPEDGWEELVDIWSCHNREFSRLLENRMVPRPGGVIYGSLWFAVSSSRVPKCMERSREETTRVFYNKVCTEISESRAVFHYLFDLFQREKRVEVDSRGQTYTMKLIETCSVYNGPFYYLKSEEDLVNALKIAFSVKESYVEENSNSAPRRKTSTDINEHFSDLIADLLKENTTHTQIGKEEVSFILQQ